MVIHHSLLGPLSSSQVPIEERIRTLSLAVCALGVVGAALLYLRAVLVPLVLAIALSYLLTPVVDLLSKRPLRCAGVTLCAAEPARGWTRCCRDLFCRLKLPRIVAVFVALGVAFAVLGVLGFIVADSVRTFASKADSYSQRVEELLGWAIGFMEEAEADLRERVGLNATATATIGGAWDNTRVQQLASKVPVTRLVLQAAESLLELLSNLFLVLLFTLYLLLGGGGAESHGVNAEADAQVLSYIKGKVLISLGVGVATALILLAVGLDLWLVFGVMAFWLNFIPNVGSVVAVLLPMPVVLLDPTFSSGAVFLALVLPFGVHAIAGNVFEPLVFGHSMELAPVTILLSLMLWGSVWGVTGMVLAVPMTAVLRIHLAYVDHPLPRYLAARLVGRAEKPVDDDADAAEEGRVAAAEEGRAPPPETPASERARERAPLVDGPSSSALSPEQPSVELSERPKLDLSRFTPAAAAAGKSE